VIACYRGSAQHCCQQQPIHPADEKELHFVYFLSTEVNLVIEKDGMQDNYSMQQQEYHKQGASSSDDDEEENKWGIDVPACNLEDSNSVLAIENPMHSLFSSQLKKVVQTWRLRSAIAAKRSYPN